jgi:hypothetical protein
MECFLAHLVCLKSVKEEMSGKLQVISQGILWSHSLIPYSDPILWKIFLEFKNMLGYWNYFWKIYYNSFIRFEQCKFYNLNKNWAAADSEIWWKVWFNSIFQRKSCRFCDGKRKAIIKISLRGGLGSKGLCDTQYKKFQKAPKTSPKDPFFDIMYGRLKRPLRPKSHCHYGQAWIPFNRYSCDWAKYSKI